LQYHKIEAALNKLRLEKVKEQPEKDKEEYGEDYNARNQLQQRRSTREKKRKSELQVGDKVRIKTMRFGKVVSFRPQSVVMAFVGSVL
jgi:hypothetical protein